MTDFTNFRLVRLAGGRSGYRYLRELLVALPKARTVDDYEALLPSRLTPPA